MSTKKDWKSVCFDPLCEIHNQRINSRDELREQLAAAQQPLVALLKRAWCHCDEALRNDIMTALAKVKEGK